MNVIELRKPEALLIGDIQNLLRRVIDAGMFLAPAGFDSVAEDIFNFVTDPKKVMFLGAEDGAFKAVILAYLPVGNLFPYPTIVAFYNEGTRALSRAMGEALMDFIVSNGYTRVLAVNMSGYADDVWLRGLTPADAKSSIAGSLGIFEVK